MNLILLATADAPAQEAVPLGTTLVFSALLIGLILCLALEEKIHAKKSIIAAVFALVCLFYGASCSMTSSSAFGFLLLHLL